MDIFEYGQFSTPFPGITFSLLSLFFLSFFKRVGMGGREESDKWRISFREEYKI